MFCPKCGTAIADGNSVCQNCGLDVNTVYQASKTAVTPTVTTSESSKKTGNVVVRFVYFGLAVAILIMFFMAAADIASGGNEIRQIESVGGKTLEEAYYYELGSIYAGYAMISRALGIFFASVLVWLGIKN